MENYKIEDLNDANSFPVQMTVLNNIMKNQIVTILVNNLRFSQEN